MRTARGFSLVEFMVAIALGLLVTDAMMSMFVSVRSASRTTLGVAALADGGRFALDTIEQAVRGAGNMACNSTAPVSASGDPLARMISGVVSADPLAADYGEPLAGYEAANTAPGSMLTIPATPVAAVGAGGWATSAALGNDLDGLLLSPPTPTGQVSPTGSIIAGSDVLVVRETQQGKAPSYTVAQADAGDATFQVNSGTTFAGPGQVGAISNCVQAEVFQVANFTPAGVVTLGTALLPTMDFDTGAQVAPIDTTAFYIGIGADGDGALYRYDSGGGVLGGCCSVNQELVPDVENMQILYGIETAGSSGTETADQYVTADQVANKSITGDFNGAISVKIALLVASPPGAVPKGAAVTASPPELLGDSWALAQADNRMRKVYEQTMFLRNMSP